MTTPSREELFELAAAYALGATTPHETAAIEAALPTSPELAAEVASFREVAAEMAQLSPVAPSASMRSRLLERVHRERPGAPVASVPTPSWWRNRGRHFATAASILIAAAAGTDALLLSKRARDAERARDDAAAHLAHREQTLNTLLYGEDSLRVIHLKAADTVTGPGIQFFWNEKQRSGVVHAFRLPPAPANHAYQVWAIVDGKPASVKVFNSDPDGHALVEGLDVPTSSRGVTLIAVTLEPAGGSSQPTTEPFLKGSVPAAY
jgi:anti-sigma-K factor RskA